MILIPKSNQKTDTEKRRKKGEKGSQPATSLSPKSEFRNSMMVTCKCGYSWEYKLRNPNKLPKRPHSHCIKCNTWIEIKRTRMINFDHYHAIGHDRKSVETIGHPEKIGEELGILKFLDQGMYAQEIIRNTSFSANKLSKIIHSLQDRGFITQVQSFPKIYHLTNFGKMFLDKGEPYKEKVKNELLEQKIKPEYLDQLRVHKLRFGNELIRRPLWLSRIIREGIYNGLRIRTTNLKNWTKYYIDFHYQDFNGLDNVEICHKVIIYNFKQKVRDQLVNSHESVKNFFIDRIKSCKEARALLTNAGFEIDQRDPVLLQKPSWGCLTGKTSGTLGALGKYVYLTIKDYMDLETVEVDDSPGIDGEEETDNREKAESVFDIPQKIDAVHTVVHTEISKVNTKMDDKFAELKAENQALHEEITNLTKTLIELAKGTNNQKAKVEDVPGGLYQ